MCAFVVAHPAVVARLTPRNVQARYTARHLRALISFGIGPSLKRKRLSELLAIVDQLPTLVV